MKIKKVFVIGMVAMMLVVASLASVPAVRAEETVDVTTSPSSVAGLDIQIIPISKITDLYASPDSSQLIIIGKLTLTYPTKVSVLTASDWMTANLLDSTINGAIVRQLGVPISWQEQTSIGVTTTGENAIGSLWLVQIEIWYDSIQIISTPGCYAYLN